jgi:CHAT domain-containing protein
MRPFLRRLGRVVVYGLALLAITACVTLLYFRYVQHRRSGEAQRLLDQADALAWNNQWLKAEPVFRRAELLFDQKNDSSRSLYAHVSQVIPHAESRSLPATILELTDDLKLPAAQDPETRLRVLTIRGMIEVNYDAGMSRETWTQVAKLASHQGHWLLASRAVGEEGIAAFLLGDLKSAKTKVLAAWETAKIFHDDAAHVRYASVYGAGLNELHRYKEAVTALDDAINTASRNPAVAYPSIAINSKIDALRGLHQEKEALDLANQALARIPDRDLTSHFYQVLTSRGQVYQDSGDLPHAIEDYNEALQDATKIDYWRGITEVGGDLARAYVQADQLQQALSTIDTAIAANKHISDELYFVPHNLALKAEILQKMGQPKQADVLYKKSAALIDAMLAHAPTSSVERMLLGELSDVYSSYFANLAGQGDYDGALRVIEEARGRIEAQALLHHAYVRPHPETDAERHLTALNLKLIDTEDAKERERLIHQIYDTELNLDTDSLAGMTATRPVKLAALQKVLAPDELFIEYVLASPHSFALAIGQRSVHVYWLPDRALIEADATAYRKSLGVRRTDAGLAARLYDSLLSPIPELLTEPKLVVVPDGALHLIPFDALIHDGHYLLETHTVSVVPSGTVLSLLAERHETAQQSALPYVGVAAWTKAQSQENPVFRAIRGPEKEEFLPLPESKKEVETIAADLPKPSTLLLGQDATETRFKSLPLGNVAVLHLALHGYVDTDFPDRSALVFAPQPGGADDGLLEVREIRRLPLNASLVTLSACNTGVGPVGEAGVSNLVNAFIEAGADSVVSTLWELEDHTTELLMTDFYAHLSNREAKAEALRNAQLDMLANHVSPYYWASFELAGEPNGRITDTQNKEAILHEPHRVPAPPPLQ